jgi:hypothetical protein
VTINECPRLLLTFNLHFLSPPSSLSSDKFSQLINLSRGTGTFSRLGVHLPTGIVAPVLLLSIYGQELLLLYSFCLSTDRNCCSCTPSAYLRRGIVAPVLLLPIYGEELLLLYSFCLSTDRNCCPILHIWPLMKGPVLSITSELEITDKKYFVKSNR